MEGQAFIRKSRTFMFTCGLTASHTLPYFIYAVKFCVHWQREI